MKNPLKSFKNANEISKNRKRIYKDRIKTDPRYRDAYVTLRNKNIGLSRDKMTNKMVEDQMNKQLGSYANRGLRT